MAGVFGTLKRLLVYRGSESTDGFELLEGPAEGVSLDITRKPASGIGTKGNTPQAGSGPGGTGPQGLGQADSVPIGKEPQKSVREEPAYRGTEPQEPEQVEPVQKERVQGERVQGERVQGERVQGEPAQKEPAQKEPVRRKWKSGGQEYNQSFCSQPADGPGQSRRLHGPGGTTLAGLYPEQHPFGP